MGDGCLGQSEVISKNAVQLWLQDQSNDIWSYG